jgi:hypothetical protein
MFFVVHRNVWVLDIFKECFVTYAFNILLNIAEKFGNVLPPIQLPSSNATLQYLELLKYFLFVVSIEMTMKLLQFLGFTDEF